ncbi:MAG: hypothetical protein IT454_07455 [Planctomycetes bacterium]|nr:hypothetical protein [Planctomycetota bacterium]
MRAQCCAALILAAGASSIACQREAPSERQLAAAKEYTAVGRKIRWNAPSAERFGISSSDFAGASKGGAMGGAMGGDDVGENALHWELPSGWVERPSAQFREANFFVAGDERAECYLTTLAGEAGGLAANVNRWRTQVSLPPLGEAEVAALPKLPWLGGQAAYVDFEGHWTGMSGDQSEQGWRLVGLLLVQPTGSRFLKMVGPSEVIGREVAAFRALAASFHDGAGHAHGDGAPAQTAPPLSPDQATQGLPAGHPPMGSTAKGGAGQMKSETIADAPAVDTMRNASLEWRAPQGWKRGPEKTMREVTYLADAAGQVECYVTLLGGSGGGTLANINRWCTQMGAAQLTDADMAKLEQVPMAGAAGVIVKLERGADATAAAGQDLLLGAVSMLSERALFVKMTGPRDAVEAQHAAFVEFCKSLKAAR